MKVSTIAKAIPLFLGLTIAAANVAVCQEPQDVHEAVEKVKNSPVCKKAESGVTVEILDCLGAQQEVAEKILNANYKIAIKATSKPNELKAFQRQWVKDRVKYCNQEFLGGGTITQIAYGSCFLDWTVTRANQLGIIADDPESDPVIQ